MITLAKKELYCHHCFKMVDARKEVSVIGVILLILTVCTFGWGLLLWVPYMFYQHIFKDQSDFNVLVGYKCSNCNSLVLNRPPPKWKFW